MAATDTATASELDLLEVGRVSNTRTKISYIKQNAIPAQAHPHIHTLLFFLVVFLRANSI